jgi:catechol 2,3-dioxygenase-like lactoylglutathione lyase family enzyme
MPKRQNRVKIKHMAKIKSISALVFYVKDLAKTKQFYEDLGFKFEEQKGDYIKAYINWFWIEFYIGEASNQEAGIHVQLSVDDVDEYCSEMQTKGINPEGDPKNIPAGRREFVVRDPDGYKLVFFQKVK